MCLEVWVGSEVFAALMCVVFDVVFVVTEVSRGLLGVGFAIMVSRHWIKICCVDVVSRWTMLLGGLCVFRRWSGKAESRGSVCVFSRAAGDLRSDEEYRLLDRSEKG